LVRRIEPIAHSRCQKTPLRLTYRSPQIDVTTGSLSDAGWFSLQVFSGSSTRNDDIVPAISIKPVQGLQKPLRIFEVAGELLPLLREVKKGFL